MRHSRGLGALAVCFILLGSACSQSTPTANPPAQSPVSGTPAGGPVPAQLLGDWLMPAVSAYSLAGGACPTPVAVSTCMLKLTFTATTYTWSTNIAVFTFGVGDVVVNGSEMDFFNGQQCALTPPEGVGRYTWTLTGSVIHFTSLNHDVCPRAPFLDNQSYSRQA